MPKLLDIVVENLAMLAKNHDYRFEVIQKRQARAADQLRRAKIQIENAPGLLLLPSSHCQWRAAAIRIRFRNIVDQIAGECPASVHLFMVTVVHPAWACASGELSVTVLQIARRWIQQRACKMGGVSFAAGWLEFDWTYNSAAEGVGFWHPHVHMVVGVKAKSRAAAEKRLSIGLKLKGDEAKLVTLPVYKATVTNLPGALDYASKGLCPDTAKSRIRYVVSGEMRVGRNFPLPPKKRVELDLFLATIEPEARLILVGIRPSAFGFGDIPVKNRISWIFPELERFWA